MKTGKTECSETSAYKIQTPGNYPEENIQYLLMPHIHTLVGMAPLQLTIHVFSVKYMPLPKKPFLKSRDPAFTLRYRLGTKKRGLSIQNTAYNTRQYNQMAEILQIKVELGSEQ